ncbi:MAG TPA: hydrogenase formation protein HypD, partial [Candidatus Bathyarchaeota archaeon]|nr:hydrogenase formation protein HypD [Candidatus Bathyarchaeota archaeon]
MTIEKALLELRRKDLTSKIVKEIKQFKRPKEKVRIMHVCGTHEYTISRSGIRSLLPEWIEVIPGPGCPVCVCPAAYIDAAIQVGLENKDTIIASFGDMLKVPGTKLSLMNARAKGLNLKLIYSPSEALQLAKETPSKNIMLLAVGFETTAPMVASQLLNNPPENFYILSAHRL